MHHQKYPLGVSNTYMKIMWRLVIDYYLDTEVLYKRSSDAMFLRWLDGTEVKKKKKGAPRSSQRDFCNSC
jgi:hypothetical protein